MTLSDYVKTFPRNERRVVRKCIAKALGISEVYVRMMCCGAKKIPGIYAIPIERFTGGAVRRHETSPDLYPIE